MANQVYPKLNDIIEEQMKRAGMIKDMELKQVVGEVPNGYRGDPAPEKVFPSHGDYKYNLNAPNYMAEAKLTEEQEARLLEQYKAIVKPNQIKEATKFDANKPNWSLVPFEALEDMVRVLEFGAKKYNEGGTSREEWNWAKGTGLGIPRVLAACLRHIFARMRGEINDPESGLPHLGHALCCLLFASYYSKNPEKYDQ